MNNKIIATELRNLLSQCRDILSEETIKAVEHYLDHDEYEMAFEGLFLDLHELQQLPPDFDVPKWIELAKELNLHVDSVFCPEFWKRFEDLIHRDRT